MSHSHDFPTTEVDVTLEWCQCYGEFTYNSNGNAVPTTGVLNKLLMSHWNGVKITGVLYRCCRIGETSRTCYVSLSMNDSRKPDHFNVDTFDVNKHPYSRSLS